MPVFNATDSDNAVEGVAVGGTGIVGTSEASYGVRAHSQEGTALVARSDKGRGLEGWSDAKEGVVGVSKTGTAVWGTSDAGIGVVGESTRNEGVRGIGHGTRPGVLGINDASSPPGAGGNGGWFESSEGEGVRGLSKNPHHGGVVGINTGGGVGVYGKSDQHAGFFEGNVLVAGTLVVHGTDVGALLAQLQQRLADLEARVGTHQPLAQLHVKQITRFQGRSAEFDITGSGFRPNASIIIEETGNAQTTNQNGMLGGPDKPFRQGRLCAVGETLVFTAMDRDIKQSATAKVVVTAVPFP